MFQARRPFESSLNTMMARLRQGITSTATNTLGSVNLYSHKRSCSDIGWVVYDCTSPPKVQTMERTYSDPCLGQDPQNRNALYSIREESKNNEIHFSPDDPSYDMESLPEKAWSVAF